MSRDEAEAYAGILRESLGGIVTRRHQASISGLIAARSAALHAGGASEEWKAESCLWR